MHRNKLIKNTKDFIGKLIFFLILLTFSILMYFESHTIIDVIYFVLVCILFFKFITVKLYH